MTLAVFLPKWRLKSPKLTSRDTGSDLDKSDTQRLSLQHPKDAKDEPVLQPVEQQSTQVARKHAICPLCAKRMLKRVLRRHLRTVHLALRQNALSTKFRCLQCGRGFFRKDIFDRHQVEQHGEKSGKVECMRCGAKIRERALESHMRTQNCQPRPFKMSEPQQMKEVRVLECPSPVRFDSSAAVDPLIASAVSSIRQFNYLNSATQPLEDWVNFLTIRGTAIRAVSRSLTTPMVSESQRLVLALYALMTPELHQICVQQNRILAGAIDTLQDRFGRTLINLSLWDPQGLLTQLKIHLSPLGIPLEPAPAAGLCWPDLFVPRIIADNKAFDRAIGEMTWSDYGGCGWDI